MGNNNSQENGGALAPQALQQSKGLQKRQASSPEFAVPAAATRQPQHKPLVRRSSSLRGYNPRSASLRRMRSIQRRRILEGSKAKSRPPARRTAKMEAESKKLQEEKQLLAACARGDLKKVERLVDSGVDVNSADESQMTALHFAAMHARDDVIRSLISRGAEVNTSDLKGGFTAMHWVIINADPQYSSTDHLDNSLTALAKAGCRINSTDYNFATPLHIAAQKGNRGCVQTLMRLGADPDKVDITGRNCFEVAKCDHTQALLKKLQLKYAKEDCSRDDRIYQILEAPPPSVPAPSVPAPPPPVPPPRLVTLGKSSSSEEHFYHTPEFHSPPSSPASRTSSVTPPPPPPRRRKQYSQYCKDTHIYHILEVPTPKLKGSRPPSSPRRRKARKY